MGDHVVIKIIGRMVKTGTVTVAGKYERAGPGIQHEREIFAAHERRNIRIDIGFTCNVSGHGNRLVRLIAMVDRQRIIALVSTCCCGAECFRYAGNKHAHARFDEIEHLRFQCADGARHFRETIDCSA